MKKMRNKIVATTLAAAVLAAGFCSSIRWVVPKVILLARSTTSLLEI